MKETNQINPTCTPLIVGIDWADGKHDVQVKHAGRYQAIQIDSDPQSVEALLTQLQTIAAGRPVHIAMEKSRVALFYQIIQRENVKLYLVDPKQLARYRESFTSGGAKDDARDSTLLARLLAERQDELTAHQPDDQLTRLITSLSQNRRALVDDRTRLLQQLQSKLKTYHPMILSLVGGNAQSKLLLQAVKKWPDPRKFRRLHPSTLTSFLNQHRIKNPDKVKAMINAIRKSTLVTNDSALIEPLAVVCRCLVQQIEQVAQAIEQIEEQLRLAMAKHEDAKLFTQLPGAGEALAPRLLAAFGSRRERFKNADEVGVYSGVLPVTKQSGKTKHVSRRRACPKFLRQTFHEFAAAAKQWCPWSQAYYRWLRDDKNVAHHAAIRKLASRWIRILFKIWKSKIPYQADIYIKALTNKNHPAVKYMKN